MSTNTEYNSTGTFNYTCIPSLCSIQGCKLIRDEKGDKDPNPLGGVLLEQVCLEPFLEGGETVSVPDGGGELVPPLGGQAGEELVLGPGGLERWDHQAIV